MVPTERGPSVPASTGIQASRRRAEIGWRSDRWTDLGRLKLISLVLPITFLVVVEVLRYVTVERDMEETPGHVALAALTVVGVVGFSLLMFALIDRAQRRVQQQNQELAAAHAVSEAIRGSVAVEETIDAAIAAIMRSTGSTEVSVTRFGADGQSGPAGTVRQGTLVGIRSLEEHELRYDPESMSLPLMVGSSAMGLLRVRLPERKVPPPSYDSLQTMAQQLATALQTAALIGSLERGKREGHAFFDVLLQLSNQRPLADTLGTVVHHLSQQLASDEAVLSLGVATARSLSDGGGLSRFTPLGDGTVCLAADPHHAHQAHAGQLVCPVRAASDLRHSMAQPIRGPWGTYGELWVARRRDLPYDRLDHRFLESMAELVSVAITNARMREHEERNAVLAERERIAREMHDGMAQVLGVTHLRLRALEASPELADARAGAEITELAELCQEAYRDVREGILGLHESSQPERALLDSLREYAAKFERQTGITTTVVSRVSREPELSPRCELQVVRVVQEALTNVRKHADAHNVVVWVAQSVDGTTFVIEDDGRGFDVAGVNADSDGFGLRSMRERMELLEGSLVVDSAPGSGTRVVATVRGPVFTPSSEVDHVDG